MIGHADIGSKLRELNDEWLRLALDGELERAWIVSDEALALRARLDCSRWPRHCQFIWRGSSLHDRRVLVRCYHGLGDTVQFVRFVPALRRVAKDVTLWVQPALVPLLGTLRGGAPPMLPLHDGAPDVEYDVDIELAELMHAQRVSYRTPDDLAPCRVPYLLAAGSPPNGAVSRFLGPRRSALRVGLVWRAGEWNGTRSIPATLLRRLKDVPDVEWWLFQRGEALSEWPHDFGRVPPIDGMLTEAQAMRELDLLITVDTCSAHLAGAIGVPVWTLLPFDADWRWMRRRNDTPWYPTMRLYRQHRRGGWESVLDEVTKQLADSVASPAMPVEAGNGCC